MKEKIHPTMSSKITDSMTEKVTSHIDGTNCSNVVGENTRMSQQVLEPLEAERNHLGNSHVEKDNKQGAKKIQNMDRNVINSRPNEREVNYLEETVPISKYEGVVREVMALSDRLQELTDDKEKLKGQVVETKSRQSEEQGLLQLQISKLEQNCKHYQEVISQFHANEQSRKREVDQVLLHAKDCLEKERQEKFASISEQKSLRQQLDSMSKSMKNMQVKNEEFVRLHCDQEDQVEDFKRLKKLIQDNGMPTIEQVISLQHQNETFREDLMNERKEKERLVSLKDKLKRDLDQSQSRISSLQEQVYKYREHIFFLQQKFKQDPGGLSSPGPGPGPPSSPLFDESLNQTQLLSGASKLYGSSAPQYINKQVLQGAVPPKYPVMPVPEKKQGQNRHGDGSCGKPPWQYQQGHYGKYGRQVSLEDWKRGPPGQGPQSPHQAPWETYYNSVPSQSGRLSSSSRSGSSVGSLEDMAENGHEQQPFTHPPRRQGPRPSMSERSTSDDGRGMMQGFGAPQHSAFEAWQPKQGFHMNRNQRRYSSSNVHSMRSNPAEFWPQQQNATAPRAWQDQSSYPDSPVSTSSSLRPGADPWLPTSQYALSSSQSPTSCTSYGDNTVYTSAGFGSH